MNILNPETILTNLPLIYGGVGAVILRVAIALVLLNAGRLKLRAEKLRWNTAFRFLGDKAAPWVTKLVAYAELITGLFILLGYMTQSAALLVAIIYFAMLFVESEEEGIVKRNFVFYWLMLAIALALLFIDTSYLSITSLWF